jgi:hypothetical protein
MFLLEYMQSLVSLLFLDFPSDSGGPTAVGIATAAIYDVNNVHAVAGLPAFCCLFHGTIYVYSPTGHNFTYPSFKLTTLCSMLYTSTEHFKSK